MAVRMAAIFRCNPWLDSPALGEEEWKELSAIAEDEKEIERRMNELIGEDLPVRYKYVTRQDIPDDVELTNLPDNTSETIRLVYIGDYDVCPCIGKHVRSTSQIGRFEMLGTNWDEEKRSFRIRYKVVQ